MATSILRSLSSVPKSGMYKVGLRGQHTVPTTKLFINNKMVESQATEWVDLHNPATNELVTRVPLSTRDEMETAVEAAKAAYRTWSKTSILTRQQVLLRYQHIIRSNMVPKMLNRLEATHSYHTIYFTSIETSGS